MNLKSFFRQRIFDLYRLTYFFKVSYIRTRAEFPLILNRQGLTGKGVEVGVWKGELSDFILKNWKGEVLYSIDPWRFFASDEYTDDMNIKQNEFDEIHYQVKDLLKGYGEHSKIVRKTSQEAAGDFENGIFDFVYLDGRHSYEGLKEDIELWYPKVKVNGFICGHDYLDGVIGQTDFGVKQAVDEFKKALPKANLIITDKDKYPSWFILKY